MKISDAADRLKTERRNNPEPTTTGETGAGRRRASSPWNVETYAHNVRGLAWNGDWWSAQALAEMLSGEDYERISERDVQDLLDLIEQGIARRSTLPASTDRGHTDA